MASNVTVACWLAWTRDASASANGATIWRPDRSPSTMKPLPDDDVAEPPVAPVAPVPPVPPLPPVPPAPAPPAPLEEEDDDELLLLALPLPPDTVSPTWLLIARTVPLNGAVRVAKLRLRCALSTPICALLTDDCCWAIWLGRETDALFRLSCADTIALLAWLIDFWPLSWSVWILFWSCVILPWSCATADCACVSAACCCEQSCFPPGDGGGVVRQALSAVWAGPTLPLSVLSCTWSDDSVAWSC